MSETGWLLEIDGLCLGTNRTNRLSWMPFTLPQALRFARREDALAMKRMLVYLYRRGIRMCPSDIEQATATEHIWESPTGGAVDGS